MLKSFDNWILSERLNEILLSKAVMLLVFVNVFWRSLKLIFISGTSRIPWCYSLNITSFSSDSSLVFYLRLKMAVPCMRQAAMQYAANPKCWFEMSKQWSKEWCWEHVWKGSGPPSVLAKALSASLHNLIAQKRLCCKWHWSGVSAWREFSPFKN